MKRTFKGFTLVECLVAMAILAIACLILGGIESTVARTNNYNHFMNSSLSNQMAYIEKYEQTDTVMIENKYSGTTPPDGTNSGDKAYVKITNSTTNEEYSYPVDIYVMYSRDTNNVGSNNKDADGNKATYGTVASGYSMNGTNEAQGNLRYKYILGASK